MVALRNITIRGDIKGCQTADHTSFTDCITESSLLPIAVRSGQSSSWRASLITGGAQAASLGQNPLAIHLGKYAIGARHHMNLAFMDAGDR